MAATFARVASVPDQDQDELLPRSAGGAHRPRFQVAPATAAIAALLGVAALLALAAAPKNVAAGAPISAAAPLTVRALLSSDELTDITTDNLMAMHSDEIAPSGRSHLRAQVASSLRRIDEAILEQYPDDHVQLGVLEVNASQKEATMRLLSKFGDARMIRLTHDIGSAVDEHAQGTGDGVSLQDRISNKLAARLPELQQLTDEMFPGRRFTVDLEDEAPALGGWHPEVEVDLGGGAAARRLASLDAIDGGVRAHAQTFFESLHAQLGDKMPTAPARMLLSFGDSSTPDAGTTADGKEGHEKLITCVTKAVPDMPKVIQCIISNIASVMAMAKKFISGGVPKP